MVRPSVARSALLTNDAASLLRKTTGHACSLGFGATAHAAGEDVGELVAAHLAEPVAHGVLVVPGLAQRRMPRSS
jgi:hypothetical protein